MENPNTLSDPAVTKKKTLTKQKKGKVEPIGKSQTPFFTVRMFTLMLLLAIIGYWGYQQVMSQMYGRFDLFSTDTEVTAGVPEGWYGEPQVILINPARTEVFLRKLLDTTRWPYGPRDDNWPLADTLWYAKGNKRLTRKEIEAWRITGDKSREGMLVDFWKDNLTKRNIHFKMYEEPALLKDLSGFDLMILPGAVLLSDSEKVAIKRFVANGGNLIMCWSVGARNENAEWVGFDYLSQLIGAVPALDVRDTTGGTSVVLNGNSPITAMIPPGTHLDFFTYNAFITMEVVEPRSHVDGWWFYPYWRENAEANQRAMIIHGEYLRGKFVWFSFTPETIQDAKDNHVIFDRMVGNAISWVHGKPLVNVSIWPEGYRSAAALLLEAAGSVYDLERAINQRGFNSITYDLLVDTDLPIGSNVKLPTQVDWIIKANSKIKEMNIIEQNKWLQHQTERIEKYTGKKPVGLMTEKWDSNEDTYIASARSGLRFVLSEEHPRFYGPIFRTIRHSGWWIFQRKSDLMTMPKASVSIDEWLKYRGIEGYENAALWMLADVGRIANTGGIYLGIFDVRSGLSEEGQNAILKVSKTIDSIGMWRVPVSRIMERFGMWHNIKASADVVTKSRIRVNISNVGNLVVKDLPVTVYLIRDFESVSAKSEQVGGQIKRMVWNRPQGTFTFTIDKLNAKDNITIYIDVMARGPAKLASNQ